MSTDVKPQPKLTPADVRRWAHAHGFTGRGHVHTLFFRKEPNKVSHKVELLTNSVRISALIRTPPKLMRWIKGPMMWKPILWGYYVNLRIDGDQLKGLRLSR